MKSVEHQYGLQMISGSHIGLFKMFSHRIWGIFNIQIQSERGHKFIRIMYHIKVKTYLIFVSEVVVHSLHHF